MYLWFTNNNQTEHFANRNGSICKCCTGKSIRQCMDCENCGYCVDKFGRAGCVEGNLYGPYDKNLECQIWKHSSPWSAMLQRKKCFNKN